MGRAAATGRLAPGHHTLQCMREPGLGAGWVIKVKYTPNYLASLGSWGSVTLLVEKKLITRGSVLWAFPGQAAVPANPCKSQGWGGLAGDE